MNKKNIFRGLGFSKKSNNDIGAIGRFDDFVIYTLSDKLVVAQVNSMGVRFPKQKHVIKTPRSKVCYLGDFKILNFDYLGEKEFAMIYINEEGIMEPVGKDPDFAFTTVILFSHMSVHETYYLKEQYHIIPQRMFYINTRERICGELPHDSPPAVIIEGLSDLVNKDGFGSKIYQEIVIIKCSKYGAEYRVIIVKNLYEQKVRIKIHLFSGEDDCPYLGSFWLENNIEFAIGIEKLRIDVAIHGRYIYVGLVGSFVWIDMFELSKLGNIIGMFNTKEVFRLLKKKKMVEATKHGISNNRRGRVFEIYFDLKGILVGLGTISAMDYFDLVRGKTTYKDLPEKLRKETMGLLRVIVRVQGEIRKRIPEEIKWRLLNSLV